MLFDDYSVGFFAMMFLGIPAYGLSKAIAKTMAEGGSSKKEGLRSVHEIPTVKKYEKKGYSANFVLHDCDI